MRFLVCSFLVVVYVMLVCLEALSLSGMVSACFAAGTVGHLDLHPFLPEGL